jgi:hypothetical protein
MLIKTEIDISGALALTDLLLRKLPYCTNNALTRTAKEVVDVERDELKREFNVRKQFILNRVKILKYSKADSLWTYVGIDTDVQGGPLLLTEYEDGGEKEPELGSEVAVPITGSAARPTMGQKVTPSLMYKKLNLLKHITSTGAVQYKGDKRTFVIPGVGIFQRTNSRQRKTRAKRGIAAGSGSDENIVLLYRFEPSAPLHQQMHFVQTARDLVNTRFKVIWTEEFVKEMAGRAKR